MHLVHIYGPPAAGKYTVGSALARLTGFRLFHNHLSIAAIEPVFDFGTEPFWRLVQEMRENVFAAAVQEDVSLIFTNVYEHPSDLPTLSRRYEIIESGGGEVCLVRLTCDLRIEETRLQNRGRGALGKLTDVEVFRAETSEKDVFSAIPGRPSLDIDTTEVSPDEAAMRIIRHYDLV